MEQNLKQQQIEELAKDLKEEKLYALINKTSYIRSAENLYDLGYRKLPKDSVVLSREEWNKLMGDTYTSKELDEIIAYKERAKAREVSKSILTKLAEDFSGLDGMEVEYPLNKVKELARFLGVEIKE